MTNKDLKEALQRIEASNEKMMKILVGNGEEGLCDKVRNYGKYIKWLWIALAAITMGSGGTMAFNTQAIGKISEKLLIGN